VTSPASTAFDRIVLLVMSGALAPSQLTPGQAAAERAKQLRDERAQLDEKSPDATVTPPKTVAIPELNALA
jgi:hypothetical protein